MGFVGIRDGAAKRCGFVDTAFGWRRGTTLSMMYFVWEAAGETTNPRFRRHIILDLVGEIPMNESGGPVTAAAFIAELQAPEVRLLVDIGGGVYEVKGAEKEIEKIETNKARKSAAGVKSGVVRRGTDVRTGVPAEHEQVFEPKPCQDQAISQAKRIPLNPPSGEKGPSKAEVRASAQAAAGDVLRELLENTSEADAKKRLSSTAWMLASRCGSWSKLQAQASAAARSSDWEPFCYRVRKDFTAFLLSAIRDRPPPRKLAEQPPLPQ